MKTISEIFSLTTTKATLLLLGMFLVFVWYRFPQAENETLQVAAVSESNQDSIIIPSINVNAPVVYVDSFDETDIELGLSMGVVHIKGTVTPGETGNSYIVGDSSNVFKNLPQIQLGEDVLVASDSRQSLVYQVVDIKIVSSGESNALQHRQGRGKFLTLQTSYPAGTTDMRYLVIAELK